MQATYTWTPTAADLGTNAVRVSVRNGGSTADFEDTATLLVSVVEGGEQGIFLRNPDIRLAWWKRWFHPRVPASLAVHHGSIAITSEGVARRHSLYTPELQLLAETEITASATPAIAYEYIWFAGQPVAQVTTTTGAIDWYFNDHLGTPILQTDGAANLGWRVENEPYGSAFSVRTGFAKHQPLRFPGQENAGSGELSYNIFRWYRAGWGRYTQSDPIGINGGFNLYNYAGANSILAIDAFGLKCCVKSMTAHMKPKSFDIQTPSGTRYGRQIAVEICASVENSQDCVFSQTLNKGTVSTSGSSPSTYENKPDGPQDAFVTRSPGKICMTDDPGFPAYYINTPTQQTIAGLSASAFPISFYARFTTTVKDAQNPTDALSLQWSAYISCTSPISCTFKSEKWWAYRAGDEA